jgi:5,10-methylenetetrahydromethanopterin reductase
VKATLHLGVLPSTPAAELAELAAATESHGFAGIWVADSQSLFRDAWVSLTACALRTEKLLLATGVTNPVTRHPAVVAGSTATLDELSDGRAILGIGVGASSVKTLGLKPAKLDRLAEYTHVLRALLAGESAVYEGNEIHLTWPVRPVPIYFASSGARSLELAGEIADGVLFQVGSDPALVRFALDCIARGEDRAGRPRGTVQRLMRVGCSIDDDPVKARDDARGYVTVGAETVFRAVPREEMPADLWEDLRRLQEAYDFHQHGSASAPQAALITDRIVDAIAIAGTPAEALPRLEALEALGVDGFVVATTAADPLPMLRALSATTTTEGT